MNNNINDKKIYTIQNTKEESRSIEIETVILSGLYKFSILGTNQKNINDTKDRIYSALRSQKIINLKSNNKKITVNILPKSTDGVDSTYDLAVAISLMQSMNTVLLQENIIAVGELSILGKIISANNILKTLHHSKKNNIGLIVCSTEDINFISKTNITTNGIKFIAGDNLEKIISDIRNKNYHIFDSKVNKKDIEKPRRFDCKFNKNIYKLILALCTNRHVLIEEIEGSYTINFIKNLIFYKISSHEDDILYIANKLNITDKDILDKHSTPYVNFIDSQTEENKINTELQESCFGFNIIKDILEIDKNILNTVKKNNVSSILSFYKTCPCGNNNSFFNENRYDRRCLCLQRNIIKYKQKIRLLDNSFFDFHITNTSENIVENNICDYTAEDYIDINKNISIYRKSNLQIDIKDEDSICEYITNKIKNNSAEMTRKVINLSKDIQKYHALFVDKSMIFLEKTSIDIAIELFKKDF